MQNRSHLENSGKRALSLLLALTAACGSDNAASRANTEAVGGAKAGATRVAFKPLAVGDAMPGYTTVSLAGDSLHFGNGRDAGLTVLNVWATWCTSCREEMADLEGLHLEFKDRGVRVVGVSVDEASTERVKGYVTKEKLSFTIAHDREGIVQRAYQISGIPQTFVIGTDGRLLWKTTGNLHGVVDSLRSVLHHAGSAR